MRINATPNHLIISVLGCELEFSGSWDIKYLEMTKVQLHFVGKYQHPLKSANFHKMLAFNSLGHQDLAISSQKNAGSRSWHHRLTEEFAYFGASRGWHNMYLKEVAGFRRKNIYIFQRKRGQATQSSCLSWGNEMGLPSSSAGQEQCTRLCSVCDCPPTRQSPPHICVWASFLSQKPSSMCLKGV